MANTSSINVLDLYTPSQTSTIPYSSQFLNPKVGSS